MKTLWAYAYQIVPPLPSGRLGVIRTLLKSETAAARGAARVWSARLVFEQRATHILIVSDDPARDHAFNLRLEAELLRLDAAFSVTKPLAVADDTEAAATVADTALGIQGNGRADPLTS